MSKSLKKVALIVGVAALAVTGVGLLVAPSAAGLLGGISAAATTIGLSTLASIGIAGLALGTSPNLSLEGTGANARGTAFVDPNALGAYVFGTTTVPPAVVYEQLHGVNEDRVSNVLAHAWHEIESYVSLHVEAETVLFSGDLAIGQWAGIVEWRRRTGAAGQTAIAISELPGGEFDWPSTAVFTRVAHSALTWNFFADPDGNKISGGVPTRVDITVEGAHLYDPREDNAYGSGSQDFDDPSTWTFNDGNAALVLLRFIIGEYSAGGELIWGRGAAESDIDMDTFVSMADVADEVLDGLPRYRLGGMHLLDGDWEGFKNRWESETGGKVSKSGGVYRVWLPHDDLMPLTTITEADLLAGAAIAHTVGGIDTLYNCARGRYIEPTQGYRGFPYPEVTEPTEISDDGGKRILTQDFSWVQHASIAERTVRQMIRRSRFQRTWTVPIGWKGQGPSYRPFTVHTLTTKETGLDPQLVRVIDRRMSVSGPTVLVVQQEHAAIYDETLGLGDPHASNEILNRIDRLGTLTPRYIDGTAIDLARALADPFFVRSGILGLYWDEASSANGVASLSLTGGAVGGKAILTAPSGVSNVAAIRAIPTRESMFITNERIRVNVRVRKTSDPTLGAGGFFIDSSPADSTGFQPATLFGAQLELDHTDINGWDANVWQHYEYEHIILGPSDPGITIPYFGIRVAAGTFDADLTIEVDSILITRIATV